MSNYPSGIDWRGTGRGFVDVRCDECSHVTTLEVYREPWGSELVDDAVCGECGADLPDDALADGERADDDGHDERGNPLP